MIRIRRGAEPPVLAKARKTRLPAAVRTYHQHGVSSRELYASLKGYNPPVVKETLFRAQHEKCAWCELRAHYSSSPVEHYRPKAGADRHDRGALAQTDGGHYWWLTWTWENLLFSCPRCNDAAHKANFFPLAPGSSPLTLPAHPITDGALTPLFDTTAEQPLLLDPAVDDPLDHIVWRPLQTALARPLWRWMPYGITPRGAATIWVLKLAELADRLEHHLKIAVLPSLEEVEGHIAAGRLPEARTRWLALLDNVLAPSSELAAATWCVLEVWMPAAERAKHGLRAPVRPTGA
jgi:hypothetical protein